MKKPELILAVVAVMVITGLIKTILIRELFSKDKTSQVDLYSSWNNSADLYIEYTPDSLYKIEYDTIVRVLDMRSGKTINEFHVYQSTFP